MGHGYHCKYRPSAGVVTGVVYSPRFIAHLIETNSNIRLRTDRGPQEGAKMDLWCHSREDAELFADKNKRFVYHYGKEATRPDVWVVGVPWRRMLDLLAVCYEDLCPLHKLLTVHLLAIGQINRDRTERVRKQHTLAKKSGWAKDSYLHGSASERAVKKRDEHWHEAVMLTERIKKECRSQQYRRTGPRGIVLPPAVAVPVPVPLDLTVGEVLR